MPDKVVKCADCGCLALRNRNTLELVGAGEKYRREGMLPSINSRYVFEEAPVCAEGIADFSAFHNDVAGGHAMARSERICLPFIRWRPGLTPKGHMDIRLLEEQREFNLHIIDADREWKERDRADRAVEAAKVEERHQRDSRNAERRFRWGLTGVIVAAVVGQLFAGFIQYKLKPAEQPAAAPVTLPALDDSEP